MKTKVLADFQIYISVTLSTFQKKPKNEFICAKLVIILIFCNEKYLS